MKKIKFKRTTLIPFVLAISVWVFISNFNYVGIALKIGMGFSILGISSNLLCLYSNKWKMPVYRGSNTKSHISYTNKKSVKFWFLSDIIKLDTKNWKNRTSIGDVLILLGVVLVWVGVFI